MGWNNLAAISVTEKWQFSSPLDVSIDWIRVRHNLFNAVIPFNLYGYIAQVDNYQDFADSRRIYPTNNVVLNFKKPVPFTNRMIGVKRKFIKTNFPWVIYIDVWRQ